MSTTGAEDDLDFPPGYLDTLGIEDFTLRREFGRERGFNPTPSEAQNRAVDKLCQKFGGKPTAAKTKNPDEEELVTFDVKSKVRVILFEGKVLKRSTNSIVQHSSRRHMILLNDVLLITSVQSAGTMLSSEKLNLHQVFYLDQISIVDMRLIDPNGDPCAFEIRTVERSYYLAAESESDKKIWLEELEAAIFCIMSTMENKRLGWQHHVIMGSMYSAAMLGDVELLSKHINNLIGQSLDTPDESGMSALHWASLFGRMEAVQLLIESGANVDYLNSGLNTSLLLAASRGFDDVAFYLIDQGADIFIRNLKDLDCLLMAVLYGNHGNGLKNIITALQCKGVEVNKVDSYGATPLHECAGRNLSWPVQILVDTGADVNVKHGRNGLTPLQMACSNPSPDPETIRSFLDKGAHPNWRDTAKRSAFDLVLLSHQKKTQDSKVNGSSGNNSSHGDARMKETLDEVAEFVQVALPVLMEIVRKGGRYTDESVAKLRPSFQEAIRTGRELWNNQVSPPMFAQYFELKKNQQDLTKPTWTADSASPHCMLCVEKFTMSNRRHHCRGCGILCCDLCSAKKLEYKINPTSATTPPPPAQKGRSGSPVPPAAIPASSKNAEGSRTCDGCFNKYNFECNAWYQANLKAKRDQEKADAERMKNLNLNGDKTPTSGGRSGKEVSGSSSSKANGVSSSMTGLNSTMNETMQALDERGQKLAQLSDKSEEMNAAAGEFNQMTRKLLQQQQQKAALWK